MRRIAITVKRQMTCKELVSILASNNVKADRVSFDEYGVLIVPWDKVLTDGEPSTIALAITSNTNA